MIKGLKVCASLRSAYGIRIEPGEAQLADGTRITLHEAIEVNLAPAGSKTLTNQRYVLRGEARKAPAGWNGEGIRGSGGDPYQRIVPRSLKVYSQDRTVCYQENTDYIVDWYMGTIKRNPAGKLQDGQLLSLDYCVWLCRYDTIVLLEHGEVQVVEGLTEPFESRELLLPDPPAFKEGVHLANVFLGWGQSAIYEGQSSVSIRSGDSQESLELPEVSGWFEDMTPRDYYVEVLDVSSTACSLTLRMAMSGEDYGTGELLDETNLRWSESVCVHVDERVPMKAPSAYGKQVDWGLSITFGLMGSLPRAGTCYTVSTKPHMIMDMREGSKESLQFVELERFEHIMPVINHMYQGKSVRIAFFGESTTRSGRWPYGVAQSLRRQFPACDIYTSNVAVSGESSMRGIARLQDEVLNLSPDLVMIEYFINNGYSGDEDGSEKTLRTIIGGCRNIGACCVLITNNGRNPIFSESGSRRETHQVHEQMKRIAQEAKIAFVGGYSYYYNLHVYGRYFLTELKGNMLNHPYGNVDPDWGSFDRVLASAIMKGFNLI